MRKLIWVCDCCGFEKSMDDEGDLETLASGWAVIHKYEDGVCATVDLCPDCSEKIKVDNI